MLFGSLTCFVHLELDEIICYFETNMLTISDIQKLTKFFATKQDIEKLPTKNDFDQLKESVLDRMDAVFGEVKVMREEQSLHFQQHDDNNLFNKAIDKRVSKIESVPVIAHEIKKWTTFGWFTLEEALKLKLYPGTKKFLELIQEGSLENVFS